MAFVAGQRSLKQLYAALTLAFLCIQGPLLLYYPGAVIYWRMLMFFCLLWVAVYSTKAGRGKPEKAIAGWLVLCGFYALLIAVIGLFHEVSLLLMPKHVPVNMEGDAAFLWAKLNVSYSLNYLFFPLMLLAQYYFLRQLPFLTAARLIILAVLLSLVVLYGRPLITGDFLIYMVESRGLASDSNAFALTSFLAIPFLIIGIAYESNKAFRFFYVLLAGALIAGSLLIGSTAFVVGGMLLGLIMPALVAFAYPKWSLTKRLAMGIAPIAIVGAAFVLSPEVVGFGRGAGSLTNIFALAPDTLATWDTWWIFKDRLWFYQLSWLLFTAAPWAGWGPGGFYREFSNLVFQQTGNIRPAIDSALNHYLMLAGDLGLVVLCLNVVLIVLPMIVGALMLRGSSDIRLRFVAALLFTANVIFLLMIAVVPPSYFLDVLWVWSAQLVLLVVMGERYGLIPKIPFPSSHKAWVVGAAAMGIVVSHAAYGVSFGSMGYAARQNLSWWANQYEYNCYPPESHGNVMLRWCGRQAALRIRLDEPKPVNIIHYIKASNPDIDERPVTVKYGIAGNPMQTITIADQSWQKIVLPVSSADIQREVTKEDRLYVRSFVTLLLDVSRTWKPHEWGMSNDHRDLGIAITSNSPALALHPN